MSSARSVSRWPTTAKGSTVLLLLLASKAIAVYGAIITVTAEDSIQDALDIVQPGDTIEIESGNYYEDIKTRVDGTADQRITVRGADGEDAILRGAGGTRVFQVNHDYYTIERFTIDGENLNVEANDDNFETAFRDKTIYVAGIREPTMRDGGYLSALDGLIIRDMTIKNAGGECVRLRYFVTNAEIYENDLESCGLYDFVFSDGGQNGEGIYIGTSSDQWGDNKNPTDDPDICMGNLIRNNIINTKGNEGVEVKEGSSGNVIEDNWIYMQEDPNSGGIGSRGDETIIRNNHIEDAEGAGVRLGGHKVDGRQYGVNNEVYGNTMVDCMSYGVKVMASPQGNICGNDIVVPEDDNDRDYAYTGGTYGDDFDPRESCSTDPTPSPTSAVPAPPTPTAPTPAPLVPAPPTSTPTPTSFTPIQPTSMPTLATTPTPAPPTPSPTDNPESEINYLGCFADAPGSRTMGFGYKDIDGMSNEDCIDYCRNNGKQFAGTTRGYSCRCTNSSTQISRNGESTECTTACTGDSSVECGGWSAVSTWQT